MRGLEVRRCSPLRATSRSRLRVRGHYLTSEVKHPYLSYPQFCLIAKTFEPLAPHEHGNIWNDEDMDGTPRSSRRNRHMASGENSGSRGRPTRPCPRRSLAGGTRRASHFKGPLSMAIRSGLRGLPAVRRVATGYGEEGCLSPARQVPCRSRPVTDRPLRRASSPRSRPQRPRNALREPRGVAQISLELVVANVARRSI